MILLRKKKPNYITIIKIGKIKIFITQNVNNLLIFSYI